MKKVLVITKPTQLSRNGNVVLGQCEPYTGGWHLLLWKGREGALTLLTGTYEELRALQMEWNGLDETEIVERAKKIAASRTSLAESTVALPPLAHDDAEATQIMDHSTVRRAVEKLGEAPKEGYHLKPVQTTSGILVLQIVDREEEGAVPAVSFGKDLPEDLRGIVLQVENVSEPSAPALMGLVSLLVGRLGLEGRFVWVAATEPFADIVERAGLNEVIRVFPSVEAAVKELH